MDTFSWTSQARHKCCGTQNVWLVEDIQRRSYNKVMNAMVVFSNVRNLALQGQWWICDKVKSSKENLQNCTRVFLWLFNWIVHCFDLEVSKSCQKHNISSLVDQRLKIWIDWYPAHNRLRPKMQRQNTKTLLWHRKYTWPSSYQKN